MSAIYDLVKTKARAVKMAAQKNARARVFHYSVEKAHRIGGGFFVRRERKR